VRSLSTHWHKSSNAGSHASAAQHQLRRAKEWVNTHSTLCLLGCCNGTWLVRLRAPRATSTQRRTPRRTASNGWQTLLERESATAPMAQPQCHLDKDWLSQATPLMRALGPAAHTPAPYHHLSMCAQTQTNTQTAALTSGLCGLTVRGQGPSKRRPRLRRTQQLRAGPHNHVHTHLQKHNMHHNACACQYAG
jgi:hypothetical protein